MKWMDHEGKLNPDKSAVTPNVRFWGIILPFLFWLYLHHWGMIGPFVDSKWYSTGIIYHFHYIVQGVFPLWDPFRVWGWPDATDPRSFGEFNPLYLIIPFLMFLKVPPFVAFNIFLVMFYWLGMIGFYLLVLRLWKEERLALMAYVMLMFSMMGELLFSQLAVPLLLFPAIYFFYFLISFFQSNDFIEQKRSFFGIILTLSIIAITYLPFFFLIVFAAVVLAAALIQPSLIASFFCQCKRFVRFSPMTAGAGLGAIILALIPGISWYFSSKNGDTLLVTARNGFDTSHGSANVSLDLINNSGLMAQLSVGELFSDQDFVYCCFTYCPIFLVIILAMGILTRMDRQRWIILTAGFLVLLCSLADVTPVHRFLYSHLNFFHLFRNLYFFGPFLLCFLIVIATGQLKEIITTHLPKSGRTISTCFFIILVHAIIGIILFEHEHVLLTSYLTLGLSAIVFILYSLGLFEYKRNLFLTVLLLLAMLQPFQIITTYWKTWGVVPIDSSSDQATSFTYLRPLRGQDPYTEQGYLASAKKRHDESGFFSQGYYGCRYSFMLYSHVLAKDLEKYVQYKFVAYNQVKYMDGDHPNWNLLAESIGKMRSPAWVHDMGAVYSNRNDLQDDQPEFFTEDSPQLRVKEFNPNKVKITTNFAVKKFLIFNDSYHSGWRVFINGQRVPLYRSNVAFKGIWIDAGPQEIEFRFGSLSKYILNWVLMIVFILCALKTILK